MDDVVRVRDHSRPCEHDSLWPHWFNAAKARWWHEPDCLGGKEMILRPLGDGRWEEVAALPAPEELNGTDHGAERPGDTSASPPP